MNVPLVLYEEKILSISIGQKDGKIALSKPLYFLSLIEAICYDKLVDNKIYIDNSFVRNLFCFFYKEYNNTRRGYCLSFFIRPFYHLGSSDFYHLVWRENCSVPSFGRTPTGKFLRENLLYAKLDDELWELLQVAENREYLRRSIIDFFLR